MSARNGFFSRKGVFVCAGFGNSALQKRREKVQTIMASKVVDTPEEEEGAAASCTPNTATNALPKPIIVVDGLDTLLQNAG